MSTTDQMSIRYCDGKSITEKFISFVEYENLSRESITNFIMDTLTKSKLNLKHLRGKTYDGAEHMSGKVKGANSIKPYFAKLC